MVNLLIVSKNRACQLELSLRGILRHFLLPYKSTVLYTCTNDFYDEGYNLVIDLYKDKFDFIKESNFKQDVLNSMQADNKYFTCIGDDVLVVGKIEHSNEFDVFDNNQNILALNYRMGPNIKIVLEGSAPQKLPDFSDDRVWNWRTSKEVDWYYPMALMGQFYRTSDMMNYMPGLCFNNPNELEGSMMGRILYHSPLMICFAESKIIELAVNKVQTSAPNNKCGNIGIEELNKLLLSGKRIKIEPLLNLPKHINRHLSVNFEYENL